MELDKQEGGVDHAKHNKHRARMRVALLFRGERRSSEKPAGSNTSI
jgi:hypothetical protein